MKRLFLNLYLLLSIGFLAIGWTLDSFWKISVDQEGMLDAPLISLAHILAELPSSERQIMLDRINNNPDFPLALLDEAQVALSADQSVPSNAVLTTPYDLNHELQFISVGDQILMAGPINIDPDANLRRLYNIAFYLSLAFVVLLWVWPLSKDLKTLRNAAKEFGQAKWNTRITLTKHSQVLPLGSTFNDMAAHISALIENQKHLSNAVSHEIRTPLARLKFALALIPQYCQPGSDPQRRQNFLDDMQLDIKEMEDLLQELLTYASLESQREGLQFEQCELNSLAKQTIKRLQPHHSTVIELIETDTAVQIMAEPSLIERALQNLITNAQRFCVDSITVEIKIKNNNVLLLVTDDGEGIPAQDQAKIFEPFYRSDTSTNGNKGHGLGLAIINRIMERHQGKVTLSSRPGFTQFSLFLPKR